MRAAPSQAEPGQTRNSASTVPCHHHHVTRVSATRARSEPVDTRQHGRFYLAMGPASPDAKAVRVRTVPCRLIAWLYSASSKTVGLPVASVRKFLEKLVADRPRSLVDLYLHLGDLRIDLLHELHHEVYQLVLPHGF